jgi:LacI family transcriptional regulator
MPRAPSLADIAARCGVTKRTVSTALMPRPGDTVRVAAATRERIQAVAAELGYRPNRTADSFRRRQHGSVGLLVNHLWRVTPGCLPHLLRELHGIGKMLVLEEVSDPGIEPTLIAQDCTDALILFSEIPGTWEAAPWAQRLARLTIPVLRVNTNQRSGTNCLTFDEEGACQMLADQLHAQRRRRVLMSCRETGHYSTPVRTAALREALRQHRIAFIQHDDDGDESSAARALQTHAPDALILSSDTEAPVWYRTLNRLGRPPGVAVSVVSFGDSGIADAVEPRLTRVALDPQALASDMARCLAQRWAGQPPSTPSRVPYRISLERSHEHPAGSTEA